MGFFSFSRVTYKISIDGSDFLIVFSRLMGKLISVQKVSTGKYVTGDVIPLTLKELLNKREIRMHGRVVGRGDNFIPLKITSEPQRM